MPILGRKIYSLDCSFLDRVSGDIKEVIKIFSQEDIEIMGGVAKILLGEILKNQGKIKENLALGYKSEVDLDIVIPFFGSRKESVDEIADKIKSLREKLSGSGFNLDEKDVKIFKGNFENPKFIKKFLENYDLTINELVFVPRLMTLFLTDKCLRDTINGVGILSANHQGTLRRDFGRLIASPRGMARLIRFLVEGKVKSIYLPRWWIEANKEEADRLKKGVLGTYGLLLTERYSKNEFLQIKFMEILNALSITDLKKFETFKNEQGLLFETERDENFEIKKRTFQEEQEEILRKEEFKEKQKREEKIKRENCPHQEIKTLACNQCNWNCKIKKCSNCNQFEITPAGNQNPFLIDEIFCNKNLIKADVYWDRDGFFPTFPENYIEE